MAVVKFMERYLNSKVSGESDIIPGTSFKCNEDISDLHLNPWVSKDGTFMYIKIRWKPSEAISHSQDEKCVVLYNPEKKIIVAKAEGGSANNIETFIIYVNGHELNNIAAFASNIYSHLLLKAVIAYDRYENKGDDLDRAFRHFDFTQGLIERNQGQSLVDAGGALYYQTLNLLKGKDCDNQLSDVELESCLKEVGVNVKKDFNTTTFDFKNSGFVDITAFLVNDYSRYKDLWYMAFGIQGGIPVAELSALGVESVLAGGSTNVYKEKYWNGIEKFSSEEIQAMPQRLQVGYKKAKQTFLANREFFTEEDWVLIATMDKYPNYKFGASGPHGCGKTTMIRAYAGALGLPFVEMVGSANLPESKIIGKIGVCEQNGASVTFWQDGALAMCVRYGGLFLFDEANATDPGVMETLNTLLDGSNVLITDEEAIQAEPRFYYAEAVNRGDAYVGTEKENVSHLDRLDECISFGRKTTDEQIAILNATTELHDKKILKKIVGIGNLVYQLLEEEGDETEQFTSIRRLQAWIRKAGITGEFVDSSVKTVVNQLCLYQGSQSNDVAKIVASEFDVASDVMSQIKETFKNVRFPV